tara:strand:+ start:125 stop:445 length:321 start_codon:yes stop_codon:yes gene_type:complete
MDYIKFTNDFKEYTDWNFNRDGILGASGEDVMVFDDRVNSPSHYTAGKQEVIDVIEDAIKTAPNTTQGMLQAQVLKYMLRLWLKDNPIEDAKKAEWYLKRLISKMS